MDTLTAIHNRRTIHQYLDTEVPKEVISTCVEAAHQAPNHKLTWPWGFVLAGPETRQGLFEMAMEMRRSSAGMTPQVENLIRTKFLNPGALVVVTQVQCDDEFREREDYAATSCAIQNFMLAAHAQGYGTKWSTGGITRLEATYNLFKVDQAQVKIVGILWVGKPAKVPVVERPKVESVFIELP